MTKSAELYACLYVREFPGQALLRLRSDLHSKPCVVLEGEAPSERVCSLNSKARMQGMKHGMTRVEVDAFPETVILSRSISAESATKAVLLECAGAFSPRVEDYSKDATFLCAIDIAGTQGLFGPPAMLAQSLMQRVKSLGLSARIAVSHNFHAATCLAKGPLSRPAIQLTAVNGEAEALSSLPLTVLNLTAAHEETFALWGIRSLGALASLPEKDLIARIGQEGRRLRELALGIHPHLFQPVEPPLTLEERMEFDMPVEALESLLFAVNVMLDQLILRAKARVLALASLSIMLTLEGGGVHTRTIRPALPTTDRQLWIKLSLLDLQAHPPSAAILAVTLAAEPGGINKIQLGLFSPQLPETGHIDVTLARIRAIVGENNVGRAVLEDSHSPEPFRVDPFTVPRGDSYITAVAEPRASMRKLRPLESVSVTIENARPTIFLFRKHRYIVERAYGPWVVGGEWWAQSLWGFEQWDLVARAQDGSMLCCCMMRDLVEHRWQMAALYD